jgi:hypothetical protein
MSPQTHQRSSSPTEDPGSNPYSDGDSSTNRHQRADLGDSSDDRPSTGPGRAVDSSAAGLQVRTPYSARTRRLANVLLVILAAIVVVEASVFLGTYLGYSRFYISTDNAKVDGDQIDINAT